MKNKIEKKNWKLQNTVSLWQRIGETVEPKGCIATPEANGSSLEEMPNRVGNGNSHT